MGGKASLILVMGFGFIFGYIAFRINELESHSVDNASEYFELTTSHNIAVAGANVALAKLYQDTLLWHRTSDTVLAEQMFNTGNFVGGAYRASFKYINPIDFLVVSISRYQSYGRTLRDTVIVLFKKLEPWELFGLVMGFRGNDDRWITKDSTWGRVHFNGGLYVTGSPVYNDKITLSNGFTPPVGTGTNQAIFKNGYDTGMDNVPLPTTADAGDTFPFADTTITSDASFEFVDLTPLVNNDGFIAIRNGLHEFSGPPDALYFYNLDTNTVIRVNGEVSVMGRVDGYVTVAATAKIWIEGDLLYAVDPRVDPLSDDMLGLVARDADIILYKPGGGPTTFDVQSVMVSLDGKMSAVYGNNIHVFRNYGAIVVQDRIDIASYTGAPPWIDKGFYRRFYFDPRLRYRRPPHVPQPNNIPTARLQLAGWWENVRVLD